MATRRLAARCFVSRILPPWLRPRGRCWARCSHVFSLDWCLRPGLGLCRPGPRHLPDAARPQLPRPHGGRLFCLGRWHRCRADQPGRPGAGGLGAGDLVWLPGGHRDRPDPSPAFIRSPCGSWGAPTSPCPKPPPPTNTSKGFEAALAEAGYIPSKTVNFIQKDAAGETPNTTLVMKQFVGDQVDMVLAPAGRHEGGA